MKRSDIIRYVWVWTVHKLRRIHPSSEHYLLILLLPMASFGILACPALQWRERYSICVCANPPSTMYIPFVPQCPTNVPLILQRSDINHSLFSSCQRHGKAKADGSVRMKREDRAILRQFISQARHEWRLMDERTDLECKLLRKYVPTCVSLSNSVSFPVLICLDI